MKIKRFEAPSMSEALRLIKKEFGPDAVILSAKALKKPKPVFGVRTSGQVIVTAAIDRSATRTVRPADDQVNPGRAPRNKAPLPAGQEGAYAQKRNIMEFFTPITRTGRQKLRAKFLEEETVVRQDNLHHNGFDEDQAQLLNHSLTEQGLTSRLARELATQVADLFPSQPESDIDIRSALCRIIAARGWAATREKSEAKKPKMTVVLGASGVGKTTTAAKLAAVSTMQQQNVTLVSMDDRRAAGCDELARYAKLMGIAMHTAFDRRTTEHLIKTCRRTSHLIVDTPGLGPYDSRALLELKARLEPLNAEELYLLISAATSRRVMQRSVELYRPLGINRLIVTQLDWSDQTGPWLDLAVQAGLPIAYATEGPLISEGLHPVTAQWLAARLCPSKDNREKGRRVTLVSQRQAGAPFDQYVANRNSDIFHRPQCRSVQRINSDNIVIFKNAAEALGRSYKPCRMCCADLLAPKPIDRPTRTNKAANRTVAR